MIRPLTAISILLSGCFLDVDQDRPDAGSDAIVETCVFAFKCTHLNPMPIQLDAICEHMTCACVEAARPLCPTDHVWAPCVVLERSDGCDP